MNLPSPAIALSRLAWGIVALAGLLTLVLLCWLPYRFPVMPTFSDSYFFGYNNRVAVVLVGLFAVGVALFSSFTVGLRQPGNPDEPMSPTTLRWALWLTSAVALPLHLIARHTGGYVESPYFLDRIKLVLDGKVPYRDFEYVYGASFLYIPAWLSRGLHLPVADAYGLFWFVVSLVGIWMLYYVIDSLPANRRAKGLIFGFLVAMSLFGVICTGVNYSTFRFILPLFFALRVYNVLSTAREPSQQARAIFLVPVCFAALLLVSPEMALSFAAGMVCYLAIFTDLRLPANLASFAVMLLLLGSTASLASACGAFLTLNAFRSGGFNFPVMPNASIVLFLGVVALTSIYAGASLRARKSSPSLVLVAASALNIASALGRCDGGHLLLSPLGLWIAALAIASSWPRAGRIVVGSCALIFFLLPLVEGIRGVLATPARAALLTAYVARDAHPNPRLDRLIQRAATRLYGPEKASQKLTEARRFAQLHDGLDPARIYGYPAQTIFLAPFQFQPENFGPIHTRQVDPGYFYATVNLVTVQGVERKVRELSSQPSRPILLIPGAENTCSPPPEGERAALRKIFLYPYTAPVRHTDSILEPICAYIRDQYVLARPATPDRLGYAVWERRPAPSR